MLVKISLNGGTTHKDVVWEEAWLLESVCSALGLLTCKYNRQEKRLYSQAIGLKREQTDSNSHASCHTTSLSVVLSLQSTILSDTFFTTLRNPNNRRIHLFLEVFSVLLLLCICQYSGPAKLKNWTSDLWHSSNSSRGCRLSQTENKRMRGVWEVVAYQRVFETVFGWKTKQLFTKRSFTRSGVVGPLTFA